MDNQEVKIKIETTPLPHYRWRIAITTMIIILFWHYSFITYQIKKVSDFFPLNFFGPMLFLLFPLSLKDLIHTQTNAFKYFKDVVIVFFTSLVLSSLCNYVAWYLLVFIWVKIKMSAF